MQMDSYCLFGPSDLGDALSVASLQRTRSLEETGRDTYDIAVTFIHQPSAHDVKPCEYELEVQTSVDLSSLEPWQRATFEEER